MIYDDLLEDYKATFRQNGNTVRMLFGLLFVSGFRGSFLYRIGHRHYEKGRRIRAAIYTRLIRMTCNMDIEISTTIGPGICFPHTWGIVIGGLSVIGRNCNIMQQVTLGGAGGKKKLDGQSQPRIGDGVLVGAGAKILGPVTIGNEAKVGANAVVINDVPARATAVGVPAKIYLH